MWTIVDTEVNVMFWPKHKFSGKWSLLLFTVYRVKVEKVVELEICPGEIKKFTEEQNASEHQE